MIFVCDQASKSFEGENYRYLEIMQLLRAVNRTVYSLLSQGQTPAIILTGDLNACPTNSTGYAPLAYEATKNFPLNFRSVLNDDIPLNKNGVLGKAHENLHLDSTKIWTTWKVRRKKGKETIVRHCIDYILYSSFLKNVINKNNGLDDFEVIGIEATKVLDIYDDQIVTDKFLPNENYPSDHLSIAADLNIIQYKREERILMK